jgi:hypothetical protein
MSRKTLGQYQFVWWGFHDMGWGRSIAWAHTGMRRIYDWSFCVGPLEIRKWKQQ